MVRLTTCIIETTKFIGRELSFYYWKYCGSKVVWLSLSWYVFHYPTTPILNYPDSQLHKVQNYISYYSVSLPHYLTTSLPHYLNTQLHKHQNYVLVTKATPLPH